jgi:hypothetical protein
MISELLIKVQDSIYRPPSLKIAVLGMTVKATSRELSHKYTVVVFDGEENYRMLRYLVYIPRSA